LPRVLAVDPGSKRVGIAISDPSATIAQALVTIPAEPAASLAGRIAAIAHEQEAASIIVGLPRRLDGTHGPEAKAASRLAGEIRSLSRLPVELVDERMTTAAAERSMISTGTRRRERRQDIDRVAATMLLQSHLDQVRKRRDDH